MTDVKPNTNFLFTDTWLKSPKCRVLEGDTQTDYFDMRVVNLILRVGAQTKTWFVRFKDPESGKSVKQKLGRYPATSLDKAREAALKALGLVDEKKDPRQVIVPHSGKKMAALCEERLALEVRGKHKPKSAEKTEWRYKKYIIPVVGEIEVQAFDIDPHYNQCIDPLALRGKLRQAGIIHTDLVTLMNFAVRRGVRKFNPLSATKSKDPKTVRKRVLSVEEIPIFWHTLPKALPRSKAVQYILKLCLVLGCRIAEVAGMRRSEIDPVTNIWTIPAIRVKNGKKYGDHVLPLSDLAISIINDAKRATNGDLLFPDESGDTYLCTQAVCRTLRRSFAAGDWTIPLFKGHDTRRTTGSQMLNSKNGLNIPRFDKHLVLNHRSATKGNVGDEVYDHNDYIDEKREALRKWGVFLDKLITEYQPVQMAA